MSAKRASYGQPAYSVSQNFLTSKRTIARLIGIAKLSAVDDVIEIGAGKGHITRALAGTCRSVRAYEIDPRLCGHLHAALGGTRNLHITEQDFLQARLPAQGNYKVFSNIPFSATTAILRKLTEAPNPPQGAWLVMEKGAAKRFAGLPGESAASLAIKPFFDVRIAYHLRREDFHPAPGVDTVLLHLSRKAAPDLPACERSRFAAFVADCRRLGIRSRLTPRQIGMALRAAGLPPIEPSGVMLYVQWLCLFRCYRQIRHSAD